MKATKLLWVLEFPLPPGSNRVKLLRKSGAISQSGKKCKLMVFGPILDIFIDKLPEEKSQKTHFHVKKMTARRQ